jgi:hypothetical protein
MNHNLNQSDQLDFLIEACDPVQRSTLGTKAIERHLDEIGTGITSRSRPERSAPPRGLLKGRPRVTIVVAAVVATTGTVAAAAELSAHTGVFQPTPQQIASASPEDAARMESELAMGGPGEFLDPSAPDYRSVALQIASDIPYPQGYESWRDFLISQEIRYADGGTESSGALHGWFAASAFCSSVQAWRQADLAGDTGAASRAALVISEAPGWTAVTDEDPHPDASVPGDQGSTYSLFGWMLPYRDAVLASDRSRVEHLLATGYGDKCWTSDPEWSAQLGAHPEWRSLSPDELEQMYEEFLAMVRS